MALPVGHGLVGIAIAKKTKVNLVLAFILANLSDIDYLFGLYTNGDMLSYHRSPFTHSPFFALFIVLIFWLWAKLRKKSYKTAQMIGVFLIVASHWFVDSYMPFLYRFDIEAGKDGFWSFVSAHILSLEFLYNNFIDLVFYGAVYILVVKFLLKERLA